MKQLLKAPLLAVALLAVLASAWQPASVRAQSAEPGIVISLASIQEQLDDIGYLLESSGFGQFKFMINMQAKEFLKGVDMARPAGALLYFQAEPGPPDVVGFVPVTNADDLLAVVGEYADVSEGDNGVVTLSMDDGNEIFVKETEGFLFVSNNADNLGSLPADPLALIGNLPSDYNVALRLFGDRIPEETRMFIMDRIREGMEDQMNMMDDEMADLQRANMEMQMEQLKSFIMETDQAEFGMGINQESNSLLFDLRLVGKPDSKFARQVESARNHKTRFGGFLMPDSAFHGISHSVVAEEDLAPMEQMLDDLSRTAGEKLDENEELSDEERTAIGNLVAAMIETVKSTARNGTIDLGIVGKIDGTQLNAALAFETADPGALEAEIKNLVPLLEERAEGKLEVKLDAFSILGANFHEVHVAIPEFEEEARKVFGEQLTLIVGFGDDVAYLGLGAGAADLIQQAMEPASPPQDDLPMTEFNVFLAPILEMVAQVQNDQTITKMAEKLREVGRDRITVSGKAIDNGIVTRLEIQDGFLQLIQIGAAQLGAGAPPREF